MRHYGVHSRASTGTSFAILFAIVGLSFFYVISNPAEIPKKPYIGFSGVVVTPEVAREAGITQTSGILVTNVLPGSPAEKAGLRGGDRVATVEGRQILVGGDVMISIDGTPTASPDDVAGILRGKNVGDTIVLTVVRGDSTLDIQLTLEELPR